MQEAGRDSKGSGGGGLGEGVKERQGREKKI